MTRRGRILAWAVGALGVCLGAGVAHAGFKQSQPVIIGTWFGVGYAEGSMGSTRNSASTTDYIGCSFSVASDGDFSGECTAKSGTTTKTCTFDPFELELFLESMRNMTADSWIHVEWDPATMVCSKLDVWVSSTTEVKAP